MLWIQEVTGEVWISLEHNIIDTAVSEWINCLHVCDCTIGQRIDQKVSAKNVKNVNKMCFCALFALANNTTLGKSAIFRWFWFPQVVQKRDAWGGKLHSDVMASCLRNILT